MLVGEIVASQGRVDGFLRPLTDGEGGEAACGLLRVHCEEVATNTTNVIVRFQVADSGLDRKVHICRVE